MAVEVEAAGQVDEFLRILRRRIWWIVVPFVLIGSLGCFFAVVVPKKFVSETEIMVQDAVATTELSRRGRGAENEGRVAPYTIQAQARVMQVLEKTNWSDYRALTDPGERGEYVSDRRNDLWVTLPTMPADSGKQLVQIRYRDTQPERATLFLNMLVESWTEEVLSSKRKAAEKELVETVEELHNIENQIEKVNEEIRRLRSDYEIAPVANFDAARGQDTRPPVFRLLEQTEMSIVEDEEQREELVSTLERMRLERDALPEMVPIDPAAPGDPIEREIQKLEGLRGELNRERLSGGYSSFHSEYKKISDRIDVVDAEINTLRRQQVEDRKTQFGARNEKPNDARLALADEILRQEIALGQLERRLISKRSQVRELRVKADAVHEADRDLQTLYSQKNALNVTLESLIEKRSDKEIQAQLLQGVEGNPFSIHLRPTIPTKPTSPNPWMIAIGSLVFGLGLGLGLAILKEYSRNCFRSARELSRVMTHPVLGKINTIRTRRERARSLLVQSVLGGGSLLFALSVAYVTWAWARNRDGLTKSLVDAIDSFRQLLM